MPFGEDLTRANYGSDTIRQKFTGYEKDTETGLDFAEARYYNNALGRFTAVDPLLASGKSANPQTFNRYSYTMNNPLNLTDPSGMQSGRNIDSPLSRNGDGLGRLFNEDVEADYSQLAQETILLDESLQKVSSDITVWNNHPMGEAVVGTYGGAYNFFAGTVNGISSIANFIDSPTSTNPRNRPFSYLPYFSPTSQIQAEAGDVTGKTLTGLSILFGGVGSTATRPSFAGFSTGKATSTSAVEYFAATEFKFTESIRKSSLRRNADSVFSSGVVEPVDFAVIKGEKYLLDGNHRTLLGRRFEQTIPGREQSLPFKSWRNEQEVLDNHAMFGNPFSSSTYRNFFKYYKPPQQ